jgi:hypothetical protein
MTNETGRNSGSRSRLFSTAFILASTVGASGQSLNPLGYSVTTPRPISPAEGTTTPSAQATQRQNPHLGSVPSKNTETKIELCVPAPTSEAPKKVCKLRSLPFVLRKAQRLPVISVTADYGGGGANIGNFNQVYTIAGNISVPIYTGGRIHATGGRIHADVEQAQAESRAPRGRVRGLGGPSRLRRSCRVAGPERVGFKR